MNDSITMRVLAAFLILIALGTANAGPITLTVLPSLAPNVDGSPSIGGYDTNAITGLENGQTNVGSPSLPTAYSTVSQVSFSSIFVTDFPSWLGLANPGTAFGPAFANELGNRLDFGLVVNGNGTQFSLSQLSFSMNSTDPGDSFQFDGNFTSSDSYSSTRVGYIQSTNTFITSGPATQLVDELIYVGVGNAFEALSSDPGATDQDKLSADIAEVADSGPFSVTTVYSITSGDQVVLGSGSATVEVGQASAVPEPASLSLLLTGTLACGGMLVIRRRRAVRVKEAAR